MFGLNIGDRINTGQRELPISMFQKEESGVCWAILGDIKYLEGFGYYGDRVWLISTPERGFIWKESKWTTR